MYVAYHMPGASGKSPNRMLPEILSVAIRCGTVRAPRVLESKGSGAMAVRKKRDDATPGVRKAPQRAPLRTGLSPTVERMFGALVDTSDEGEDDNSAASEGKRASRPGSP